MHNKHTAKITVSKFDPESKYMDLKINLDCYFGNDLKVSNTAMKLVTLFKEVHNKVGYLQVKDINNILSEDDYGISYDLQAPLSLGLLNHYKLKIISSFNTRRADDQYQIVKVEYKLFVEIDSKATLNSIYGVSDMYPHIPTKEEIAYYHHDIRLLDSIKKESAHTTPKKVICSDLVTTVIFEDGSKSQVRCSKDDEPNNDYEKAFMMAWLYQLVGKKTVRDTLEKNQNVFYRDNSWGLYDAIQNAVKVLSNNKNSQSKKVKK